MRDAQEVLSRPSQSPFRSRIHSWKKELDYLRKERINEVLKHAAEFIEKRWAPALPMNDGKQTLWHIHPVFVASYPAGALRRHATATCCRGCLQKWHQIPKGRELTTEGQQYTVEVIGKWLSKENFEAA